MRPSICQLKHLKSTLVKKWKPRPLEPPTTTSSTFQLPFPRHPELFTTQIILSDGSSFQVRSTAPRSQVKITKDTRSHTLWNPQLDQQIDDEGGYLSSFQKKFSGFSNEFSFADDAEQAKKQMGTNEMMKKKRRVK